MKAIKYTIFAVSALLAASCAKPQYGAPEYNADFLHDDCTIHSIYCTPVDPPKSTQVAGKIDNEAGTIVFEIPHDSYQKYYNVSQLKLKANIGYDAVITPSMTYRIWDLSEPVEFTVTAKMTGRKKTYVVEAYKTK